MYSITAELGKEKQPTKNSFWDLYIIPTLEMYLCVSIRMRIYTYIAQLRACIYKMEGYVGKGVKRHWVFHTFLWNSLQLCVSFSTMWTFFTLKKKKKKEFLFGKFKLWYILSFFEVGKKSIKFLPIPNMGEGGGGGISSVQLYLV